MRRAVVILLAWAYGSPMANARVPVAIGVAESRRSSTDFVLPSGDRVEGELLSRIPGMTAQASRVRAAVKKAYGVEIGDVPIHVVSLEDIRTLHNEVGGRLRSGWQLHGFELEGHVFVRRGLGGISDEVLIHECLHAMSQVFANEAHAMGLGRLVEGVTQYLALGALALRPPSGMRAERNHTYIGSTDFAEALSSLVGPRVLQAAYFGGGMRPLVAKVDALRHGRQVLIRAAHALDEGNEQAAMSILTGSAR